MAKKKHSDIVTHEMRESLKSTFQVEVEKLPELLNELEAKERINVILKMMPFLLPSVKSVHYTEGEPMDFSF
jgi:hypothetical protein